MYNPGTFDPSTNGISPMTLPNAKFTLHQPVFQTPAGETDARVIVTVPPPSGARLTIDKSTRLSPDQVTPVDLTPDSFNLKIISGKDPDDYIFKLVTVNYLPCPANTWADNDQVDIQYLGGLGPVTIDIPSKETSGCA